MQPTAADVEAAGLAWINATGRVDLEGLELVYFRENWSALPGLRRHVDDQMALRLELALHQIAGHGNITGERARQIASEALGIQVPS